MSGNTGPKSFQLAEPLWNDPGLNGGTGGRDLIPSPPPNNNNKKKKKKRRRGMNRRTFPQNPRNREKCLHRFCFICVEVGGGGDSGDVVSFIYTFFLLFLPVSLQNWREKKRAYKNEIIIIQ